MWTTIRVSLGRVRCNDPNDLGYNPTSTNDSLCGTFAYFTNCGAEGRFGPTQLQCDEEYGPGVVVSNGGIQRYTVTKSGVYRIEALGAQGGEGIEGISQDGGFGARIVGSFVFEAGDILNVVVGQVGSTNGGGSGGGGSFLWTDDIELLIAAGGGGGAGDDDQGGDPDGRPGQSGQSGSNSANSTGAGGFNGHGGTTSVYDDYAGGGGAGWLQSGSFSLTLPGTQGLTRQEGFYGGVHPSYPEVMGGFGGGGANGDLSAEGGGGGGGYSGGGGGDSNLDDAGGGGGSFNSGSNQVNESGVNEGHGSVTITLISAQ